jgi:hypothetical protein
MQQIANSLQTIFSIMCQKLKNSRTDLVIYALNGIFAFSIKLCTVLFPKNSNRMEWKMLKIKS